MLAVLRYGAMWWLNTDGEKGRMYPAAPPTSYTAQGAGGNYIWMVRNISLRRISLTINEEEHLPRQARDRQTDRHENNQTRCKGLGGVCAGADVRSRCGGALVWRLQGFHSGANGLLCIVLYSSPVQYVAAHTTRVIEGTKNELSIPCKMHSTHSMRTVHAHSILSSTCNG